jgi:hypothetical protein
MPSLSLTRSGYHIVCTLIRTSPALAQQAVSCCGRNLKLLRHRLEARAAPEDLRKQETPPFLNVLPCSRLPTFPSAIQPSLLLMSEFL